ncbi:MAG: DUF6152 family protein [Vicinamibacteria bacterium]
MQRRYAFALTLAAGLAAAPALAHHGWSEYDNNNSLTLTGTIAEAGYEHPHGFIKFTVDGKAWVAVLAPPSRMENRGLPRAELVPGATITLVGYPNRSKPEEMRAERITIGGRTVELR